MERSESLIFFYIIIIWNNRRTIAIITLNNTRGTNVNLQYIWSNKAEGRRWNNCSRRTWLGRLQQSSRKTPKVSNVTTIDDAVEGVLHTSITLRNTAYQHPRIWNSRLVGFRRLNRACPLSNGADGRISTFRLLCTEWDPRQSWMAMVHAGSL